MDIVSNSRISEGEYTRWKDGRKAVNAPILTMSECKARHERMVKIVKGHKVTRCCQDVTLAGIRFVFFSNINSLSTVSRPPVITRLCYLLGREA